MAKSGHLLCPYKKSHGLLIYSGMEMVGLEEGEKLGGRGMAGRDINEAHIYLSVERKKSFKKNTGQTHWRINEEAKHEEASG